MLDDWKILLMVFIIFGNKKLCNQFIFSYALLLATMMTVNTFNGKCCWRWMNDGSEDGWGGTLVRLFRAPCHNWPEWRRVSVGVLSRASYGSQMVPENKNIKERGNVQRSRDSVWGICLMWCLANQIMNIQKSGFD